MAQQPEGSVFYDHARQRWRAYVWIDGRRRYLPDSATKAEARRRRREALVAQAQGRLALTPDQTAAAFLDSWFDTVYQHGKRPNTLYNKRRITAHLTAALGGLRLRDLTPARIDQLYHQLITTHGQVIAHHCHIVLHQALESAVDYGYFSANPTDRAHPPSYRPRERRTLSPEQARALLAVLDDDEEYGPLLTLILHTGLRVGEAIALHRQDIDLEGDTPTLRVNASVEYDPGQPRRRGETKTPASRRQIPLSAAAVAAIRRQIQRQSELQLAEGWRTDILFPGPRAHTYLSQGAIYKALQRNLHFADLPAMAIHDLRHSNATIDLISGGDLKHVQERLGHASERTTMRYVHPSPASHRQTNDRLSAVLLPEPLPTPGEAVEKAREQAKTGSGE